MDDQNPQDNIQDAEVVEDTSSQAAAPANGQVDVLLSLEEMIKSYISSIDKLRDDIKKQNEMFADSFGNDATLKENEAKVKEVSKALKTTREQIRKQPAVAMLADKIKSMRLDLKEKQAALSDYLLEYQRMTGANEIEGPDGDIRDITNSAKLVKRSSGKK